MIAWILIGLLATVALFGHAWGAHEPDVPLEDELALERRRRIRAENAAADWRRRYYERAEPGFIQIPSTATYTPGAA